MDAGVLAVDLPGCWLLEDRLQLVPPLVSGWYMGEGVLDGPK